MRNDTRGNPAPGSPPADAAGGASAKVGSRLLPSHRGLVVGFVSVLVLMAGLAAVGLAQIDATQARLERIVEEHMVKLDLVATMRRAAHERTLSLQR